MWNKRNMVIEAVAAARVHFDRQSRMMTQTCDRFGMESAVAFWKVLTVDPSLE